LPTFIRLLLITYMFDDLYSQLTKKVDYKLLTVLPIIFCLLLLVVVYGKGFALGLDFKGGTWIEAVPEKAISLSEVEELKTKLSAAGLKDIELYLGKDILSGKEKLTLVTTSQVNSTTIEPLLVPYVGRLREIDHATAVLPAGLPADVRDKIKSRFSADVSFNESSGVLVLDGYDLDKAKLESALSFYLGKNVTLEVQKKNINTKPVGETLGKTFREQAMNAFAIAYVLIIVVIFVAFRDPIPSFAVILSGTCDAIFAIGGMSLFNIALEPSSVVAILMVVGYSVDTDILLTTRVLRGKTGTVNDRIDNSIKTGLTMTGITMVVMAVILIVSTFVFRIDVFASISSVLLLGLVGDVFMTWFTNTGILKWYVEEHGGKIDLIKRLKGLMGWKQR
jgi:preprotein translocase subunit SecF